MFFTGFECIACAATQPSSFKGFTCPACGGNLTVTYDYDGLKNRVGKERLVTFGRPDLFRYAPLLPLERPGLASPLRIGWTPLYPAPRLGTPLGLKHLYLKDDGLNPSASFKDRAGAVALVRARETGARVIAGASTGNAGSSMACLAASVGMPCVIFVPEKAPPAKIAQLLVFGARVMAVRGTYDDAFDLCMKVCAERGWFNRNTGHNPFTREGKKTCSFEICEQLGWHAPDRVVVATGDGNILSGIWKGMKDLHAVGLIDRLPKIDCAQSEKSDAVTRAVQNVRQDHPRGAAVDWKRVAVEPVKATTLADSISVDAPRDGLAAVRAVIESGGEVCTVPDEEILSAIPELARGAGVFAEPAAACAWAVTRRLAMSGRIQPEEKVVCLITGNGLKDAGAARKAAGEPTLIKPTVEAALAVLADL
ncbi:MAG TPA: threonine synthase [Kiritimatiellia bacterium]|nr:threonine synthase [Kiritimatiellia bacterium]HRZ13474.1 threonine synthase [Kiritimatiellia bacterium]HSA19648.1 threonine synthase [Kiritimatiellia bacterium]